MVCTFLSWRLKNLCLCRYHTCCLFKNVFEPNLDTANFVCPDIPSRWRRRSPLWSISMLFFQFKALSCSGPVFQRPAKYILIERNNIEFRELKPALKLRREGKIEFFLLELLVFRLKKSPNKTILKTPLSVRASDNFYPRFLLLWRETKFCLKIHPVFNDIFASIHTMVPTLDGNLEHVAHVSRKRVFSEGKKTISDFSRSNQMLYIDPIKQIAHYLRTWYYPIYVP